MDLFSSPPSDQASSPLAERMRPKVRALLALCDRHGVNRFSESIGLAHGRRLLRAAFGLADGEQW